MPCKIYIVFIDRNVTMTKWVLRTLRLMDLWRIVDSARPLKFIDNGRVLDDAEMRELVTEERVYEVVVEEVQRNPDQVHLIEDED